MNTHEKQNCNKMFLVSIHNKELFRIVTHNDIIIQLHVCIVGNMINRNGIFISNRRKHLKQIGYYEIFWLKSQ